MVDIGVYIVESEREMAREIKKYRTVILLYLDADSRWIIL